MTDCGPLVWQTAYRLLGEHADSADCFQEAFLAAVEISRCQRVRNMPALLARLATTKAIDRLRQKDRLEKHRAQMSEWPESRHGAEPLDCAVRDELAGNLRDAVAQLPVQEATVFSLRHLNDMSYREIARELRIPLNTVGVLLHRAKAHLRGALGEMQTEEDEVPNGTR